MKNPVPLAVACLLAATLAAVAQEPQDEVRLRNGTNYKGRVIEVDKNTVTLRMEGGPRDFQRSEVRSVWFGVEEEQVSEIPPGFTCANGLKILRVTALRRITDVRNADQGKGEPWVVRLSGDGTKIAYWSANDALYTINFDGSDRRQLWAKGEAPRNDVNGNYLDLSPDGKYVYWLNWWGDPIHRINSDGSGGQVMISRKGGDTKPWRLRQGGKRLFFMGNGRGIYSVDTEGQGDFKEILTRDRFAALFDPVPYNGNCPADFDVSEDGSRVAFVAYVPKAEKGQLCTVSGDGSNIRVQVLKTDREPEWIRISPDGSRIFWWNSGPGGDGSTWSANYDGTNARELLTPRIHGGVDIIHNRFSADGKWIAFNVGLESAGMLMSDLEGGTWFDVASPHFGLASIPRSVVPFAHPPRFSDNFRRFAYIGGPARPWQVVAGEINPRRVEGLPIISEIDFTRTLSTNPALPNHVGTIKARVKAGTGDITRVYYTPEPMAFRQPDGNWHTSMGFYGMQGEKLLYDDGTHGDEKAGDGVYSTNVFGPNPNNDILKGHHVLRILAHDEQGATYVDVDGVDIK